MKTLDLITRYAGWAVAIVVATVAVIGYFSAPTQQNTKDIAVLNAKVELVTSNQDIATKQLSEVQVQVNRTATDVAWIRGALSNIGVKAPLSFISERK